jgi:hypothetical protein
MKTGIESIPGKSWLSRSLSHIFRNHFTDLSEKENPCNVDCSYSTLLEKGGELHLGILKGIRVRL